MSGFLHAQRDSASLNLRYFFGTNEWTCFLRILNGLGQVIQTARAAILGLQFYTFCPAAGADVVPVLSELQTDQ